jgi:hypothetical protein
MTIRWVDVAQVHRGMTVVPAALRGVRVGFAALAVLAALPAGQAAGPPVRLARVAVVVSQGPGGGAGGGSDGGSDSGSGTGGVVPNPNHPSDSDGGGREPAPEPRRPTPGNSTGTDGGARPVPPTTPALPPPADRPGPDDPALPPPGRPDVPAPATNGSVWASSSGAAGDSAPSAVSGTQVLSVDLATEAALREYERTRRQDKRGSKLDFNTTRVGADVWHGLVAAEGHDPAAFDAVVAEMGGPDLFVTQTPILLRDGEGRFGTATLFQVAVVGGAMRMLDASGARYTDVDDYLGSNQLPAAWTVIYPAGLSIYGDPGRLISAPAHTVTVWQRLRELIDRVAGPALVSGADLTLGGAAPGEGAPVIGRYQPGRDIGLTVER